MVRREELLIATAFASPGASIAYFPATIVPSGRRRYIYYFEAMIGTTFGTARAILEEWGATTAPTSALQNTAIHMHWFNFTTRGEQAWYPDELKEDSLPIAIIEASCYSRFHCPHFSISEL